MPKRKGSTFVAISLLLALLLPILVACAASAPAAPVPVATAAAPTMMPSMTARAPTTSTPAPTNAPAPATHVAAAAAATILRIGTNFVTGSWPPTLDPQKSGGMEIMVERLNYEGLTRLDKNLETVPAAAERWEYDQNATAITFHLRDGLTYSDGSPLTARDFANATRRALDPHSPGYYQTALRMIAGAEAIINTAVPTDEDKLPDLNKQLGVQVRDDRTITFTFVQPTPYFHTLASLWVLYPVKQALVDKGGETWYEDPANLIGNGPFQLTRIDKAVNLIELKANNRYWQGRPKLDGLQLKFIPDPSVALQAYKSGEVDIITPDANDIPAITADPALKQEYVEHPGSCTFYVGFNLTKAPFDNLKVRQAFAYAFDRDAYIRDALKGTGVKTLSWIPQGYPGFDAGEQRYAFDIAKARELLAAAGFPEGNGLPEIKYAYPSGNPSEQGRAEYLAQMYRNNLGAAIVPDPIEDATLYNLELDAKTFPQMTGGGSSLWCADFPDPQNWLSNLWRSRASFARGAGYANPSFDRIIDAADSATNQAKRLELYAQAQQMLIGDVPIVTYMNNKNGYLIKPYVKGIVLTAQDISPGDITGFLEASRAR